MLRTEGANGFMYWDLFIFSQESIPIGVRHLSHGKTAFFLYVFFLLVLIIYFAVGPNGKTPNKSTDETKEA